MILAIFMVSHLFKLQQKDELKIQQRLYIKLSTTENAPYTYRLQETDDISLVGYSRFIPTEQLSNPFNIPDFQRIYQQMVILKNLNVIMIRARMNYLQSAVLWNKVQKYLLVFRVNVTLHILKADFYLVAIMHCLIYKVKLIMLQTRLGIILSLACNLLYLMSEIVYMLRFIHLIFHLMTHSLRFNYGCLLNKKSMIQMKVIKIKM